MQAVEAAASRLLALLCAPGPREGGGFLTALPALISGVRGSGCLPADALLPLLFLLIRPVR